MEALLDAHDLPGLTADMPILDLLRRPTHEEAMASMRSLGTLERGAIALARFRGSPPWEKHPEDELVHVLEGSLRVVLLPEEGEPRTVELTAGSLFVVPRETWHRSHADEPVTLLAVTSVDGNASSLDEDPRG